jgi:fluoride exporter
MSGLYIFIGGGLGAMCRWAVSRSFQATHFPWATLTVNLVGCFLIGLVYYYTTKNQQVLHLFAVVGFLGGFTTFSSYSLELMKMIENGLYKNVISYFLVSNVLGIGLVYIGYKTAAYFIS